MKKLALALTVAAAALFAGCQNETASTSGGAAVKPYPLATCIVSGEKLGGMGEPIVKVYNGQEIKFCCKDCVKDFEKDQAKFLSKLK